MSRRTKGEDRSVTRITVPPGELERMLVERLASTEQGRHVRSRQGRRAGRARVRLVGALSTLALLVFATGALAVHDEAFRLDGDNLSPPAVDWQDLFDVSNPNIPTPKATLPTDFIAATFVRDFVPGATGPDRTTFTTGSKDTLNVTPGWQCARDNNVNDKTDLVNVYAAAYAEPDGDNDLILYLGLERFSNEGAGNVSFWILQDPTVDCLAPATGPSTTSFTGNHMNGDILVVSEFTNGGVIANLKVYEWVGGAGGSLNTTPIGVGVDCSQADLEDPICAEVNTSGFTPPWLTETKQPGNTPSNALATSEFFEAGINISDLGLGGRCFNRILADTRSSPSLTASIFDYAIGSLPLCDLEVTKTGDTISKVGDDVSYTITIENTGVVELFKESIVDDLLGDLTDGTNLLIDSSTCGDSLASGASCTITLTRTVQAGDPDPLPNTVEVTYNSSEDLLGDQVSREDDHSVNLFQPAIDVDKTGDTLSKVGDDVNYTITLSNDSSADTPALTCTATDTLLGVVFGPAVLAPGDTVINDSRTVEAADPDPLENTVNVTCSVAGFSNVLTDSDDHSVNLFQPGVEVIKTGPASAGAGDTVTYAFTINNLSSSDAPDLILDSVTDTVIGDLTAAATAAGCDTLASPGGTCNFTADYTIQASDPNPLVNVVTVHYHPDGFPNDITDDDDHSLDIVFLDGCTPGFWQGGAGSIQWNVVNDPDWTGAGTNPFIHTTLFNSFFSTTTDARLNGLTMFDLVSTGGTSDSARRAARDMVAAYLNETAFPASFPATSLADLTAAWYAAVSGGDAALDAFHTLVSGWNDPEDPGGCPLP